IRLQTRLPDLANNMDIIAPPSGHVSLTRSGTVGDGGPILGKLPPIYPGGDDGGEELPEFRAFTLGAFINVSIANLEVFGMQDDDGGAITVSAFTTLTLDHVQLHHNVSRTEGGAITNNFLATLIIQDCHIYMNTAQLQWGGAIANEGGDVTI